jgi:hypothetical protein
MQGDNYLDLYCYNSSHTAINYAMDIVEYSRKAQTISGVKSSYTYNGTGKKYDVSNAKSYGGSERTYSKLTYKSSNTKILTVDSYGIVTLKGYGKATVTITAPEIDASTYYKLSSMYTKATKKVTITVKPAAVNGAYLRNYNSKYKTVKKTIKCCMEKR